MTKFKSQVISSYFNYIELEQIPFVELERIIIAVSRNEISPPGLKFNLSDVVRNYLLEENKNEDPLNHALGVRVGDIDGLYDIKKDIAMVKARMEFLVKNFRDPGKETWNIDLYLDETFASTTEKKQKGLK
jgi:hypothetical protein